MPQTEGALAGPPFPNDVAAALVETARRLYVSEDLDETLTRITSVVTETLQGCDCASVSLLEGDRITTRAPTAPVAEEIDRIQYDLGEGPCLEAATAGPGFVYTPSTRDDRRWPQLSPRMAALGVGSVLSCRLAVIADRERTLGGINMYAMTPDAFSEEDQLLGVLLASHAGVVVDAAHRSAQLHRAIESRDVIGQAKGILMERHRISSDEAFDRLRHGSQHLNVKLAELAARLAETGEEPAIV